MSSDNTVAANANRQYPRVDFRVSERLSSDKTCYPNSLVAAPRLFRTMDTDYEPGAFPCGCLLGEFVQSTSVLVVRLVERFLELGNTDFIAHRRYDEHVSISRDFDWSVGINVEEIKHAALDDQSQAVAVLREFLDHGSAPLSDCLVHTPYHQQRCASNERSKILERIRQCLICEVGVDFSRRDIAMPESAFDEQQVRCSGIQVSRKRVPETVRRDTLSDPGSVEPVFEPLRNLPIAESCATCRDKERPEFAGSHFATLFEIVAKQCPKRCLQELNLSDAAFGHDANVLTVDVYVIDIQTREFRESNTGAQKQLEDSTVAAGQRVCAVSEFFEQPALLGFSQELGRRSRQALCGYRPCRVGLCDAALGSPGKERADNRLQPMHCRGGLGCAVLGTGDCGIGKRRINDRRSYVGDASGWKCPREALQVTQVSGDSVFRTPLRPEPCLEVGYRLFDVVSRLQQPDRIRHGSPPVGS